MEQDLNMIINYATVDKEYKEFLEFLQAVPKSLQCELTDFLYPFYVHLYMMFLLNKNITDGQKFLSSYYPLFLRGSGYENVIKTLQDLKQYEDFKNHDYFKQFCENKKYNIDLSEKSITQMRYFFEEYESSVLLYVFQKYLFVRNKNVATPYSSSFQLWNPDYASSMFGGIDTASESQFRNVIKQMQEKLRKPTSYTYQIFTEKKNLCSVSIDFNDIHIACGLETAEILLYDLASHSYKVEKSEKEMKFTKIDLEECFNDVKAEKILLPNSSKILRGHTGPVFGLDMSPNGDLMVSCSKDGTARVWNLLDSSASVYKDKYFDKIPVWDVAFSPDSSCFATASVVTSLWIREKSIPFRTFVGHEDNQNIDCVIFHPNSNYIATAADKFIELWAIKDSRKIRTFSGHEFRVTTMCFTPDGKYLVSADAGGFVKIWDLKSGLVLKEFKPHNKGILCLSFNKSGSLLTTGGFDQCLKVWDAQNFGRGETSKTFDENIVLEDETEIPLDYHMLNATIYYAKFCKGCLISVIS